MWYLEGSFSVFVPRKKCVARNERRFFEKNKKRKNHFFEKLK